MVKAMLLPAPALPLGHGVPALLEQLERHCLAPDGTLVSKPAYNDLLQAREEMSRERLRYLEALVSLHAFLLCIGSFGLLWCGIQQRQCGVMALCSQLEFAACNAGLSGISGIMC